MRRLGTSRAKRELADAALEKDSLLYMRDLSVSYGGKKALDGITLRVRHGAQVAVVGPNGAGKSTLFKVLVGLVSPEEGSVLIHGHSPSRIRDPIAYVPQREEVDWRFPVTVYDVVAMGRYGQGKWLARLSSRDRELIQSSLERLGVAFLADRPIGELSGGQQQRVFLARALAQEPHVLLLDEPFTGVDLATKEAILGLLDELRHQGVTTLVSTHDLDLASARFDEVVLLNRRLVAAGMPEEVFTQENLARAFGSQMVLVNGKIAVVDQCCGGHGPVGGTDSCLCESCDKPHESA
ncbi:MAG: metal ABC transporter ATP-binding protein [Thermoleophilia bacterium]|nr:metal ABC transporter ATP-binding protein [Thermoleophilia bacterium]